MSRVINKMEIPNKIKKANKLILAQFKMTTYEQKIILLCISKIKPCAQKTGKAVNLNLTFELTGQEIKKFLKLNANSKGLYSQLHEISEKLESHKIYIYDKNSFTMIRPFPFCRYENEIFTLRFEQSMEEYLLELKDKFTVYNIDNIVDLKSNYSIRIYEVLKSYEWLNEAVFDLDEFKKIIGVKSFDDESQKWCDLYPRYPNFKQRVLLVAQKELEEKTDIQFDFIEIKIGRKVAQIKFIISNKANGIQQEAEPELIQEHSEQPVEEMFKNQEDKKLVIDIDDLVDELREFIKEPLKTKDLKTILMAANNDIALIKSKYELAKQQKKISNLAAWLISAVRDDYSNPVEVEQCTGQVQIQIPYVNRFVNYEQDKWDFEELEKLEREYINKNLEI